MPCSVRIRSEEHTSELQSPCNLVCRVLFRSDRKSTRLNSSHLVISYAVFCLKKAKPYRVPVAPGRKLKARDGAVNLRLRSMRPQASGYPPGQAAPPPSDLLVFLHREHPHAFSPLPPTDRETI